MERKIEYTVEKLDESFAEKIAENEKICFSVPWSINSLKSEMKNPLNTFLGAVTPDKTVLGYVGWQQIGNEVNIFNVAVIPKARRKGIGANLISDMIISAKKKGAEIFNLEVRPSNLPAIGLYESNGFVFYGIRKNYYENPKENAILMRLAFDGSQEDEDPIDIWDE